MTSVVPEPALQRPSVELVDDRVPFPDPVPSADKRWLRRLASRLFLVDALVVGASLAGVLVAIFGTTGLQLFLAGERTNLGPTSYLVLGPALAVAWVLMLLVTRAYDGRVLGVGGEEYRRVARASVYLWGLVAVASYLVKFEFSRLVLGTSFLIGTIALLFGRWLARKVLHRARVRSHRWSHRVLAVGGSQQVADLVAELERAPYAGLTVVGACMPPADAADGCPVPVVGSLTSVPDAVARLGIDTVAVTSSPGLTSGVLKRLGWELEGAGVDLVVAPALTDVAGPRVHVRPVSGLQLLYVEQPEFTGPIRLVKEAFDRTVAAVALALVSPFLLLIATAIRLTSAGPIIFRQVRVGRNGESFTLFKFRTMHVGAERRISELRHRNESDGVLFKLRDDPRVTRVGRFLRRFSLDELPQLANVLLGTMSLVGPRPALPSETERYGHATSRRLLVKPGITGLWQVSGRSDLSWEDSVRLDLYYVENWSFAGDVQILWKTVSAVVRARGAY